MKRKFKSEEKLPKYVYPDAKGHIYRPYIKGQPRRKYRITSDPDATIADVWAALEDFLKQDKSGTVKWLLDEYMNSYEFTHRGSKPKSDKTISDQRKYYRTIIEKPLKNKNFGEFGVANITPGTIKGYLDKRLSEGAGVSGNLEVALISKAWNWAYERDKVTSRNPCMGVTRNPTKADDRYVTDDEYNAFLQFVKKNAPPYIWIAMELSYLCRMRKKEVLETMRSYVLDEGLDTHRVKESRDAITTWTPRLRSAVDAALALNGGNVHSMYLLTNLKGQRLDSSGFDSVWKRWQKTAKDAGIETFTFHNLKAKGISDFDGDKQAASGHKTAAMVVRYDRKKPVVKATR